MVSSGMIAISGLAVLFADGKRTAAFPPFTWDTLPVAWHSDNGDSSKWTSDELQTLARYAAVTFEKTQGGDFFPPAVGAHKGLTCQNGTDTSGCGCCEEDYIVRAAKVLKSVNADVHVFAYVNSVIAYPWYAGAQRFLTNESYWLRDVNGTLLNNIKMNPTETWYTWNHGVPAVADIFKAQCKNMTDSGFVNGCFVDGCTKVPGPLDSTTDSAYRTAKPRLLAELETEIPGVLICGSNGKTYEGTSGSQIQNWGKGGQFSQREIPMMLEAVSQNKMFEAHGEAVCQHGGDPSHPAVQTELAAFLVAAGKYSYYMCGGFFGTKPAWYPVYDLPLGAPLGDAKFENGVYTRSFASGTSVLYNTSSETGSIQWASTLSV